MAALFPGVDRASFAVGFGLRLREAGLGVGLGGIEAFVRALELCPVDSVDSLYWTARVTFVKRCEDLVLFEAVFRAVFAHGVASVDPNARRRALEQTEIKTEPALAHSTAAHDNDMGQSLPWATLPTGLASAAQEREQGPALPERMPSSLEAVADIPFEALDLGDLHLLDTWLITGLASWPTRRSRRMGRHYAGRRVTLRPTLARARRTGFEPVKLVASRPLRKPRPVVMLCDVSQSMQHQAAAYFHLMRAVATTTDAEVFAFATRLTRLTSALSHRSAEVAIEQASAKVTDRFGGTRIATNLRALLASSRADALRGAIVLVASDGWDSDPPEQLAAAMARLSRRAHRVIWMNPRAAAPGFAPMVGAMAAALPYCDDLLPGNTIRSLTDVVAAIVRLG